MMNAQTLMDRMASELTAQGFDLSGGEDAWLQKFIQAISSAIADEANENCCGTE